VFGICLLVLGVSFSTRRVTVNAVDATSLYILHHLLTVRKNSCRICDAKAFTLAYPSVSETHSEFMEDIRRQHDGQYELVKAHFTLLFGHSDIEERMYLDHVREVAELARTTAFVCRYAMLGADNAADRAYVYLVPDEGYSGISLLHDALYRQVMAPLLRLDIPYVPHITLGSSTDRKAMKALCDRLNETNLSIHGSLNALTVAAQEGGSLVEVASFSLSSP
jgi:2'-5' RNA ligase